MRERKAQRSVVRMSRVDHADRAAVARAGLETLEQRRLLSTTYTLPDVPVYHSLPEATQKIFLDFNGHIVEGTSWNSAYNYGQPIHAEPYSRDDDIFNFSDEELDWIEQIWREAADDFAPFNVDVTTEDPGEAVLAAGSQGIRVMISPGRDSAAMGGTGRIWNPGGGGLPSWTHGLGGATRRSGILPGWVRTSVTR